MLDFVHPDFLPLLRGSAKLGLVSPVPDCAHVDPSFLPRGASHSGFFVSLADFAHFESLLLLHSFARFDFPILVPELTALDLSLPLRGCG